MEDIMSASVHPFWWRWLLVFTFAVILFGLCLLFLPDVLQSVFNSIIYGDAQATQAFGAEAVRYITFSFGISGAVMVGWMVLVLYMLYGSFRRGEAVGWNSIALSIGVWYVLDSAFSGLIGYPVNILLNTGFVIGFVIPLAATYRAFHPAR